MSSAEVRDEAKRKEFETLRAQLAMKAHQLVELADGSYLAGRWGQARPLRDLHAVAEFARMVGATS